MPSRRLESLLPSLSDKRDKGDKRDIFDNKNNFVADVADVAANTQARGSNGGHRHPVYGSDGFDAIRLSEPILKPGKERTA